MQTETYEFISYALNTNLSTKSFRTYCFKIISFKLICLKTNIPWKCLLQGQNWNQTIFWFKTKDIQNGVEKWKISVKSEKRKRPPARYWPTVWLWAEWKAKGLRCRRPPADQCEPVTPIWNRRWCIEERKRESSWRRNAFLFWAAATTWMGRRERS